MAGGCQVLLGIGRPENVPIGGSYCATGMHGGVMYIRGEVDPWRLGKEVKTFSLDVTDREFLKPILEDFATTFDISETIDDFDVYMKIAPVSTRPYGRLYVY